MTMNGSEQFSNMQNTSEGFSNLQKDSKRLDGIGRGKKYPGAEIPEHEQTRANFSLVMEEAYAHFEQAGERRSVRMIAEYCKTGELVCYYDSDDQRWHITPESVQNKIEKIKALNARKFTGASVNAVPKTSEETPTKGQSPDENTGHTESYSDEQMRTLRAKIRRLTVDAAVSEKYIERLEVERDRDQERLLNQSHRIGVLETEKKQLQQLLEAPKERESDVRDAEFIEPLDTSEGFRSTPSASQPKDPDQRGSDESVGGDAQPAGGIRVEDRDDSGDELDDPHKPFNSI
jgi:hypothetical protein